MCIMFYLSNKYKIYSGVAILAKQLQFYYIIVWQYKQNHIDEKLISIIPVYSVHQRNLKPENCVIVYYNAYVIRNR